MFRWLFQKPLAVGSEAPPFRELELHAARPVLLVFYVADDTPT